MLYQVSWLVFSVLVGILAALGLLGILFSPSIPSKPARIGAVIVSILVLLAGSFFSYQWNYEKKDIRALTRQAEQAMEVYLEKNQKQQSPVK